MHGRKGLTIERPRKPTAVAVTLSLVDPPPVTRLLVPCTTCCRSRGGHFGTESSALSTGLSPRGLEWWEAYLPKSRCSRQREVLWFPVPFEAGEADVTFTLDFDSVAVLNCMVHPGPG